MTFSIDVKALTERILSRHRLKEPQFYLEKTFSCVVGKQKIRFVLELANCQGELFTRQTIFYGRKTASHIVSLFELYSEVIDVFEPESLEEMLEKIAPIPKIARAEIENIWRTCVRASVLCEIDGITRRFHKVQEYCTECGEEWMEIREKYVPCSAKEP